MTGRQATGRAWMDACGRPGVRASVWVGGKTCGWVEGRAGGRRTNGRTSGLAVRMETDARVSNSGLCTSKENQFPLVGASQRLFFVLTLSRVTERLQRCRRAGLFRKQRISVVCGASRPSVRPSLPPSVGPSVRPPVRPPVRPSVRPSVRPFVLPSVRPSVRPSVHPFRVRFQVPVSLHVE